MNDDAPIAEPPAPACKPAGLLLTLGAAFYDAILLVAILFVATAVAIAANAGEAIAADAPWFKLYLLAAGFPYFGWCWTRSGQTLGMKTWRIVLTATDGKPVRLRAAALRYLFAVLSWAIFLLGYLWMLADKRQRSWHDIVSATQLVRIAREST